MHICFLCGEYPLGKHGGIGSFIRTLGRRLVVLGHEVSVVGIYPVPQRVVQHDEGVRVIQIPATWCRGAGFLFHGLSLRRELRALDRLRKLDVVESPENGLALLDRSSPGFKVIRMHGGHRFFANTLGERPRFWRSWIEKRSFSLADDLCGVSRFVAEKTRQLLHLGDRRIEILPNPVDTNLFLPMPEVEVIPGRIVFVGTLCEKKGIRQLVDAMPRVIESVPHGELVVCGRDSIDKASGRSFRSLLEERILPGIRSKVQFRDHVNNLELPRILASAEVLAYPSHMEAFPVAWLEGLAMGKAVVASNTGPGPEAIEDGVTGVLCDPRNPLELASALLKCLKDPVYASKLGIAARRRVVRDFDIEPIARLNERFYISHGKGGDRG